MTDPVPGPSACSEETCDKPVHAGGRCQNHYRKFKKYGTAHPTPEMKKSPGPKPQPEKWRSRHNANNPSRARQRKEKVEQTHCAQGHELSEDNVFMNKSGVRGCKTCRRDSTRRYRERDPQPSDTRFGAANRRKTHCPQGHPYDEDNTYVSSRGTRACRECRRVSVTKQKYAKYGIDEERFNEMLDEQHGLCGICATPFGDTVPHIDHCHATGEVRGLLCGRCNTGIGQLLDSPEVLYQAIDYITKDRILDPDSLGYSGKTSSRNAH